MKKSSIVIIVVIAIIVILAIVLITNYNSIISVSEEVDNKFSTIDRFVSANWTSS